MLNLLIVCLELSVNLVIMNQEGLIDLSMLSDSDEDHYPEENPGFSIVPSPLTATDAPNPWRFTEDHFEDIPNPAAEDPDLEGLGEPDFVGPRPFALPCDAGVSDAGDSDWFPGFVMRDAYVRDRDNFGIHWRRNNGIPEPYISSASTWNACSESCNRARSSTISSQPPSLSAVSRPISVSVAASEEASSSNEEDPVPPSSEETIQAQDENPRSFSRNRSKGEKRSRWQ